MNDERLEIVIREPTLPEFWGDHVDAEWAARAAKHHAEVMWQWAQGKWPEANIRVELVKNTCKEPTRVRNAEDVAERSKIERAIADHGIKTWERSLTATQQ